MQFFVRFDVKQPATVSNAELFEIWKREAEAALGAMEAGAVTQKRKNWGVDDPNPMSLYGPLDWIVHPPVSRRFLLAHPLHGCRDLLRLEHVGHDAYLVLPGLV